MIAQRPRARPAGDRRPRAQPLLERAPVVPGGARVRAGQRERAPLHLPRRQGRGRRRAAQQLGRASSADPAWTRVTEADGTPGQWYLHLFDVTQPDFDWTNPEVRDEMESVLRFWLDRGRRRLPHRRRPRPGQGRGASRRDRRPARARGRAHRRPARCGTSPVCTRSTAAGASHRLLRRRGRGRRPHPVRRGMGLARRRRWRTYVRGDELHQSFNFDFLMTPWIASELRQRSPSVAGGGGAVGAPQTWVLSNHDVVRHALAARATSRSPACSGCPASVPTTRSPTPSSACAVPGPRRP